MKTKQVVVALGVGLLLMVPALADSTPINGAGYYGGRVWYGRIGGHFSGNGGEFTLINDGPPGLLLSNSAYVPGVTAGLNATEPSGPQVPNPESFQTFCVETAEYVAQPMDIHVSTQFIDGTPGSHAWDGGPPNGTGDNLDPMTAYLYTKFATGNLLGLGYGADYNYNAGRTASADALQKAIWWIEGETGGENNYWVTLANDATHTGGVTDEWVGMGIGDVRVLQMYWGSDYKQDQLWLIPAPGAALLGVLGLSLVGWVKRRLA